METANQPVAYLEHYEAVAAFSPAHNLVVGRILEHSALRYVSDLAVIITAREAGRLGGWVSREEIEVLTCTTCEPEPGLVQNCTHESRPFGRYLQSR